MSDLTLPAAWSHPAVLGAVALLTLVALVRRWAIVLLLALLFALVQGLQYLLHQAAFGEEFTRGVVVGIYGFGGVLLLFLLVAERITRR